ncbi:MAG: FtsX-like permease family protein [Acidimicrobiia bacterium]|nr:FtsX-like permease family protein [Acidimicrobiia bacterium]
MRTLRLLLRWSWRDLRSHWAKVLAIALVIAIGTGGYAGLTSTAEWRRVSYDLNYGQLAMYDLRIDLATGSFVEKGEIAAIVSNIPSRGMITAAEERLIVPTQVDASTGAKTVLVRGELTGSDFSADGPHVNSHFAHTGRLLSAEDAGQPLVMLERSFARFYELPESGTVELSGGRSVEFVGQATTPEYFAVAPEGEMFMTEATFGAIFTTLETAQQLAGMPGAVNNLVLTLADGTDRDQVQAQLTEALESLSVGATVLTRDDNLSYTSLTTDVDQDQAIYNALAFLLFAGAVGAAFNLIHRLVEQQRREIGIGMALGIRPRVLGFRPLLVSAQIAILGVALGVGVGMLIGNALAGIFDDFVPLPVWETDFQYAVFARVALAGLVVPFVASALPVWRALRVKPIEAIRPDLTGRGSMTGHRRTIGNTFAVIPFRNLRRTPRRTALTVFGIAAALTVLVGFLGIMDSVFDAVDTAESESVADEPDRITVGFDSFRLIDSPAVASVEAAATVAKAEPRLNLAASIISNEDIDIFIEVADLSGGMWRPTLTAGELDASGGIILSEKAAADLGASVGDSVVVRHPQRLGLTSYAFVDTSLPVMATHPHPVRSLAYMDLSQAQLFNLEGLTNGMNVLPASGANTEAVQEELFRFEQVASVQSVTAVTDAVREAFNEMLGIIQMMVFVVLLLALLIAFNTSSINLEARAREHATMFAFGVRVRTALRMAVAESLVIGILATVVGIAGGFAMVWWMTQVLLTETLPDFGLNALIGTPTLVAVVIMGVVVVTLAPLLTVRRMRRMDLPGTLRLVE